MFDSLLTLLYYYTTRSFVTIGKNRSEFGGQTTANPHVLRDIVCNFVFIKCTKDIILIITFGMSQFAKKKLSIV